MFARQASLKNLKFYIFLDRKIDQISGKGPLLSVAPFEAKELKNFWRNAHIHKIRTRITFEKFASSSEKEILGMGLVEASQMHRLREQGGA